MIKLLLSGVWVCAITLASTYASVSWRADRSDPGAASENLTGVNYEKTGAINVPMIADGGVQGYVVAQFVFTADAATLKGLSVPPGPFILDEAFRTIYADERIDFRHLEQFDLATLTHGIVERVNARFRTELVQDLLVEQFTYVSKDEVRSQAGAGGNSPVLSGEDATGHSVAKVAEAAPAGAAAHEGESR